VGSPPLVFPPLLPLLPPRTLVVVLDVVWMAALSLAAPCFSIHRLAKKPIAVMVAVVIVVVVVDGQRLWLLLLLYNTKNKASGRVEVSGQPRSVLLNSLAILG
jgi:hypothetical protein